MTVSSTGGASERWPSVMGVYKITNITHSGRPVWQSTVREDIYLFYNGNKKVYIFNVNFLSPYKEFMESGLYMTVLKILVHLFGQTRKAWYSFP